MNNDLILAKSPTGEKITVRKCRELLAKEDRKGLANFIYDRLYGRYLKPFDFSDCDYQKNYKSGFAIMASCCLLIETYMSFRHADFRDTKKKGAGIGSFIRFFEIEREFRQIHDDNLSNDFYSSVRNGILHNAETRNGWSIDRSSPTYLGKKINATEFAKSMKRVLERYKERLITEEFNSEIWNNFKNRLNDLIDKS